MTMTDFPGGSKSRVNRAGENIRNRCATPDDLRVIDEWRAAHRNVLNTFQATLRIRTRGTSIVVAQRHKRKSTIFGRGGPGCLDSQTASISGWRPRVKLPILSAAS